LIYRLIWSISSQDKGAVENSIDLIKSAYLKKLDLICMIQQQVRAVKQKVK